MKFGKTVLIVLNVVICLSFGFFVLTFSQAGKPYIRGFYCNDESINKPYKSSTITSTAAVIITCVLGVFCFVLSDLINFVLPQSGENKSLISMLKRTKKVLIRNLVVVILIYLYGMGLTMFLTDIGKYSIGRLRPHFYDVCQPDWSKLNCTNAEGVSNYFIGDDYCKNKDDSWRYKNVRLSFPSGHASYTAYCATFLILYLDRFIQTTNPMACLPKMFFQVAMASGALYCGLSRVSDYKHHATDVLAGTILGFIIGIIVFFGVLVRSCLSLLKIKEAPSLESVISQNNPNPQTQMTDVYNVPMPGENPV